jgi:dTDP-4-amino-4,6-dideoxygalactose transaminase
VPWYEHREIGFNYRMGNLNAAVGRGQLRTLSDRIDGRRRVRESYERYLSAAAGVRFQAISDECESNHWLTTIAIDPDQFGASSTDVIAALRDEAIEARHGFKPMHLQPVFDGAPTVGGTVSAELFETTVSLPSSARLGDDDIGWICDVIRSAGR